MVTIALVTRPGNDRAKPDALPAPVLRRPRVQLFLVPPVTKHVSDLRIEAWQPTHALQPTGWTSSTNNIELSKSRQDVSGKGRTYLHYLQKKTTDYCVFCRLSLNLSAITGVIHWTATPTLVQQKSVRKSANNLRIAIISYSTSRTRCGH